MADSISGGSNEGFEAFLHWKKTSSTAVVAILSPKQQGWKKMLEDYEQPPLDEGVNEELQAFIDRRKGEMQDAWY